MEKIGIVVSDFNADITHTMEKLATEHVNFLGGTVTKTIHVPGAFDMALAVKKLVEDANVDGVVTLAEPDLFYTGGTLIFDHGHGVSTLYMHMKTLMVKKGQKVKQGDVIGTVGSTGRSTGAHLDVRLNWFQTRLDPATVLNFENN